MNKEFKRLYKSDKERYKGRPYTLYEKRFHYLKRRCETTKGLLNRIYTLLFYLHSYSHQMEIKAEVKCGEALYLSHPYSITINKDAVIGNNCTLYKGAMIGSASGTRKGVPVIGDNCFIGMYACIVGGVTIGDNVLIAPNSFVNVNVPSNSIVFGNPCIIKEKRKNNQNECKENN